MVNKTGSISATNIKRTCRIVAHLGVKSNRSIVLLGNIPLTVNIVISVSIFALLLNMIKI